jgi:hypothetical protein
MVRNVIASLIIVAVFFLFILFLHFFDCLILSIIIKIPLLLEFKNGFMKILCEYSKEFFVLVGISYRVWSFEVLLRINTLPIISH